jgi:hypothetical protein
MTGAPAVQHIRDFFGRTGANNTSGWATEASRPIDRVGLERARVGQDMRFTDDGGQICHESV